MDLKRRRCACKILNVDSTGMPAVSLIKITLNAEVIGTRCLLKAPLVHYRTGEA